jgi:hypothetical protein
MGLEIEIDKTKLSRSGTGKSFFRKFLPDSVRVSRKRASARRAREKTAEKLEAEIWFH